jgi:chitinase
MKKWLFVVVLLVTCLTVSYSRAVQERLGTVATATAYQALQEKTVPSTKIAAYIRTWPLGSGAEIDKGVHWTADQIQGEYLTDLIIAFAQIDPNDKSSLYVFDMNDQPSAITPGLVVPGFKNLWQEVAAIKGKYPGLRVNASVGGWGAEFSDTVSDPELRSKLIDNIYNALYAYNLDGVDIDWEYPVGPEWGQEIKSRPEDRGGFIALLVELRSALDRLGTFTGKHYGLSACIPASGWYINSNDVVDAANIVDSLTLMAYDYYGGWSATTGHQANLSNNPADPAWGGWSTKQALDVYLNAGVPPEKILLGVAFYGRAWAGVENGGTNGLFQNYTSVVGDGLAWPAIKEFLKPGSGFTRYWDEKAQSPYLYNGDIFVTYTDEEAVALIATYAKEKGLGGVFTWEYAHDINGELLKILYEKSR